MKFPGDEIPADLRALVNGLTTMTASELDQIEKDWAVSLVTNFGNDEANDAWNAWQELKNDELSYLISPDPP